ncbi:MAG: hypothetical protein RLZZ21_213 [Planctomycetota bacterium]|jgi:hypothetical protein
MTRLVSPALVAALVAEAAWLAVLAWMAWRAAG